MGTWEESNESKEEKDGRKAGWEAQVTHRERFVRVLTGREVDRVPFIKVFGGDNAIVPQWEAEHPGIGEEIDKLLRFEGPYRGWQTTTVDFWMANRGEPEVEKKADGSEVHRWQDGTVILWKTGEDFHVQYIEWPVKTMDDWVRVKGRHLALDEPSRFPPKWAECVAEYIKRDYPLQLTHGGVYGFSRNLMGDEALAYAFYDDPELVQDMMTHYTTLMLILWEKMVAECDYDLIEFWEDMASKNGALISPATFREFMKPQYLRVAEFAKEHGIEIILVDSDGYIEDLTGLMLVSGATAMYPYEVQSGNDVPRMLDTYPKLGVIGGLNKNVMAQGREAIDREMEKARALIRKGRFIPGPDHFVLSDVTFENYRYFMERLREVVMGTAAG